MPKAGEEAAQPFPTLQALLPVAKRTTGPATEDVAVSAHTSRWRRWRNPRPKVRHWAVPQLRPPLRQTAGSPRRFGCEHRHLETVGMGPRANVLLGTTVEASLAAPSPHRRGMGPCPCCAVPVLGRSAQTPLEATPNRRSATGRGIMLHGPALNSSQRLPGIQRCFLGLTSSSKPLGRGMGCSSPAQAQKC